MDKALLKEARRHGSPAFPVSMYHYHCPPDQPLLDLHWHEEMEFFMVTAGRASLRVGTENCEVSAGEAVFVPSGELHSGSVLGGEGVSFSAVVFHADLLSGSSPDEIRERFVRPLLEGKYEVPVLLDRRNGDSAALLDLLGQLFELDRTRPFGYELAVRGMLQTCVSLLLRLAARADQPRRTAAAQRTERIKAALEYIERRYAEPIRLGDLASAVSMSEAYFCRLFKRITAATPVEYINLYRVRQAAILLRSTDRKITDIALEVGFRNLSYFNTVFRQRFGCTPTEYRRRGAAGG
ncbi:MAG: AraC family transcriptional regulator [Thermobacillus sp. ZCTH02-B1]|uniref:helix-turn-helix transcriptional regulator n=1 Tax=Thermobacillus sp. ZCTH02-B1 TaxID=1858795 RepID=UPI000B55040E|nr:AraC family transcriptional regulator [Thermobacillus sp. ZCTH02-B1]OUM95185.1 MAG: AraC family transcriptional regulator [Thermobacillus sp. ZCTH02-B1]